MAHGAGRSGGLGDSSSASWSRNGGRRLTDEISASDLFS